jgi:putative Mn2+ efflux pump MntP
MESMGKLGQVLALLGGEKTSTFWAGLIILSLASLFLFQAFWGMRYAVGYSAEVWNNYIENMVPNIVGSIVFILIGLFMMKSGVKREVASAQS